MSSDFVWRLLKPNALIIPSNLLEDLGNVEIFLLNFITVGEKGGKEGLKKDSKGDEDETASVTSYESSMVRKKKI